MIDKYLNWAIKWKRNNRLDGYREWFEGNRENGTKLFQTRRQAQVFIKEHYGYIATRKDLRVEPFCWRMPKAVRVEIVVSERRG